ncbi:hypothetical protein [Carnobacterium maltaromaticum]|uniref:hypothetical protein n=2 Tax=Carnobacterium maltaromaticum TaxID=2751 RepID=UPI0039AFC3AC
MTNKLEEVFKELQESHVLVEKEEYEKLVEKAKNAKEAEIESVKFEDGEYYAFEDAIFRIYAVGVSRYIASFYGKDEDDEDYIDDTFIIYTDSLIATSARKATDEEIKLFKRAEMYHKHGRKLDDLKVGDLIKIGKGIYQMKNETTGFIQSIIEGRHELYLTIEEAQEAHKKIVGE